MSFRMLFRVLPGDRPDNLTLDVPEINHQWHGAREVVRGAGEAGIIRAESHFNLIQDTLRHRGSGPDEALCRLFH